VGQQVARGDRGGGRFIRQPQVGQVAAHWPVQLQAALVDQPHGRGGDEGLGDRADLKEGVRIDRQRLVDVCDAEAGGVLLAGVEQAQGHARHATARHLGLDNCPELAKSRLAQAVPRLTHLRGAADAEQVAAGAEQAGLGLDGADHAQDRRLPAGVLPLGIQVLQQPGRTLDG
jgi:hypothetical protein